MSIAASLPSVEKLRERRTTPDHVADLLRDAILTGKLEDGAELNQVTLAEHFAISRVPVREALRQLQAEGLVRQEAHRRAVVTTLSHDHIVELFDLRVALETYLLRRAIDDMDAATLRALEKKLRAMAKMSAADHERWLAANRDFHDLIYQRSGASYTQELAGRIAARTTRYLYLRSQGTGVRRQEHAHEEHVQIMDAIAAGDADRAAEALEDHINGTRRAVLEFLGE